MTLQAAIPRNVRLRDVEAALKRIQAKTCGEADPVQVDSDGRTWYPVQELNINLELPPLPLDAVPESLRPWIEDEAERKGTAPEFILAGALVAAGGTIGNTLRAYPKANDETWSVTPNLYGLVIAPPSTKKSPAIKEGLRFLDTLQAQAAQAHSTDRHGREAQKMAAEVRIKAARSQLQSELSDAERRKAEGELADAREQLEGAQAPHRKYIVNDATIEQISVLLAQPVNRGGIVVFRDEIKGLFATMKRSGHENDRAYYLQAFNGTSSYDVERKTQESSYVPTLTLSTVGTIQPSEHEELMEGVLSSGGGDGMMPRFQITVWGTMSSTGYGVDRSPDIAAISRAEATFQQLAKQSQERETILEECAFVGIHLDSAAQKHMDTWRRGLFARQREYEGKGHSAYSAHLGKAEQTAVRLALINYELGVASGALKSTIDLQDAQAATRLTDYLLEHARRTYLAVPPSGPSRLT
ncbi:MAG: DUF3987 domain-containing protein [Thioalkalivibrio sp.]|nr:DUF3987 domain-containing protein [Thioalkalivibrio sp.]